MGAPRRAARIRSARSPMVIVRPSASDGGSGGGAIAASRSSARDQPDGVERRRVQRHGAGERRGVGRRRLAPEQPGPGKRQLGQAQARVAVSAIDEQAGAQLGLGVRALIGERHRIGRIGPAREHRPALDQDQLAGDRDERRHVAEPVGLQSPERVEVGAGERTERHGQDVELAGLDERQQEPERAVELGHLDLRPALGAAALAEGDGRACRPWPRRSARP